jgi:hypothetical protein
MANITEVTVIEAVQQAHKDKPLTLEEAEAKLRNLTHGEGAWWYAYAMGSGCAMATGQVDIFMRIIEQADELRSFIRRERNLRATRAAWLA